MLAKRLIACLDVKDGRVVKGVNFAGLRDAGDPAVLAARYNVEGIDELVLLDVSATLEGRQAMLETVRTVARELFRNADSIASSLPFIAGSPFSALRVLDAQEIARLPAGTQEPARSRMARRTRAARRLA